MVYVEVPPLAGKLDGVPDISLYEYDGLLEALAHADTSDAGKLVGIFTVLAADPSYVPVTPPVNVIDLETFPEESEYFTLLSLSDILSTLPKPISFLVNTTFPSYPLTDCTLLSGTLNSVQLSNIEGSLVVE